MVVDLTLIAESGVHVHHVIRAGVTGRKKPEGGVGMGLCNDVSPTQEEWLHRGGVLVWRRLFPGHGSHVRAARKLPALLLEGTGFGEDVEWVAGELISNALKYTRSVEHGGWFGVETGLSPRWAWVAVRDLGGVFIPVASDPRVAGGLAEGGRGLLGVRSLASRLEICGSAATGHTVRALFDLATAFGDGQEPHPSG